MDNPEEFVNKNRASWSRQLQELVPLARAAVDALKDAGRAATAATLDRKLFEIDLLDEELAQKIRENPEAMLRFITSTIRSR